MSVRQKFHFGILDQNEEYVESLPLNPAKEIVPVKNITISHRGSVLVDPETIKNQWSLLIDDETCVFIQWHEIPTCLDYSKVRKVFITYDLHLRTKGVVFPNVRMVTTESPLQGNFAKYFPNVTNLRCWRFLENTSCA